MPKTSSLTLAINNTNKPDSFPSPVTTPADDASIASLPPSSPRIPGSPRAIIQSLRSSRVPNSRSIPSTMSSNSLEPPISRSQPYRTGPSSSAVSVSSHSRLLDTSSIAGSSIPEDAISDAGSEVSWQPHSLPHTSDRDRRPSRHAIFQNMLSRSRSTKQNLEPVRPPPPKAKTTRERLLESRSRERDGTRQDSLSPHTAPLEPDRAFRDAMSVSSSGRNRSADRLTDDGRNANESAPPSNRRVAHFKQKASDVAGRAGKGFMDKLKGSGAPNPPVVEENYQFRLLHLPLIEQTRRTRLRGRMSDAKDKTEFWMPALPYRAIDYLNSKGIEAEGLYRIPGSVKDVKHWQMRFDKEGDVNLLDVTDLDDVHTVGSMLKAWLREMPDALIPRDAQQRVAPACVAAKESGQTPQILKDELSQLPPFHYYLLFAITAHVALLYKFRDHNKMTYHNLCICFQPCLTIDAAIFQFLVEDWKNCWQGCWTEKKYLEEEYQIMEGRTPAVPAVPLAPRATPSTTTGFESMSSASTAALPKADSPDSDSPSLMPLPRTPTGPARSQSNTAPKTPTLDGSDSDEQTPVTGRSERTTRANTPPPPALAPVEPVSPMRM